MTKSCSVADCSGDRITPRIFGCADSETRRYSISLDIANFYSTTQKAQILKHFSLHWRLTDD